MKKRVIKISNYMILKEKLNATKKIWLVIQSVNNGLISSVFFYELLAATPLKASRGLLIEKNLVAIYLRGVVISFPQ